MATIIVPSSSKGFLALARTKSGQLFSKEILRFGSIRHPKTGKVITVDRNFGETLSKNFTDSVCDIVQIPKADSDNKHSEDPDRNLGEVVGIELTDKGINAILDIRKQQDDIGKTILGASAFIGLDYEDSRTGKKVGPTLLHVCATNRPHVVDLDPYKELIAATADTEDEPLFLSEAVKMTKEELIAALKEQGIDVAALQAAASKPAESTIDPAKLTQALKDAGLVTLSASDTDPDPDKVSAEIVSGFEKLKDDNVKLSATVTTLSESMKVIAKDNATSEVEGLIKVGKILPKAKEHMIELALTNRATFDALIPDEPLIRLSNELGVGADDSFQGIGTDDVDAEIKRLTSTYNIGPK